MHGNKLLIMSSEICLTCLCEPSKAHNLDEHILENLKILDLLHQLIPLFAEEHDFKLPDKICTKCLEKLVICYKFQKQCLDSVQNIRKLWTNNSLKEETVEYENNEYKSYNEGSYEYIPEGRNIMKSSLEEISVNCIDEKSESEREHQHHEKQKDCALRTLNAKLHSGENSITNEKTQSEVVERSSTFPNQCKICNRSFKQPQGLASHMSKTHFKKYLYQCQKCRKGFDAEEPFIRHCNRHLGIKPFPCSHCGKSFETKSILNKHLLCHSKTDSYTCNVCGKKFYRIDVFKRHTARHDDEEQFQCLKCDITFERFSDHVKHLETHKAKKSLEHETKDKNICPPTNHQQIQNMAENLFKCDQCDKSFDGLGNFKLHQKVHCINTHTIELKEKNEDRDPLTENEDLKIPLEVILTEIKNNSKNEKEFNAELNENELSTDNRDQDSNSDTARCDICNQTFKNSQGLAIHRSNKHFKNHLYQCDQCDRGFSVEEFYIKHRNHHLGIKTFKCKECDKVFETNSILNQHLISHSKVAPHLCTVCGKGYRRIDSLRQHMKRHGDERPFKCSACPKSFKCLSDKLSHMLVHTEKRYECHICDARLSSSESLSQHLMIHTGEKPKKCKYCDKSFISLSNLKCHERIHTGEKPYKCEYCSKLFRQSSDRKKHALRMHQDQIVDAGEKPINCKYCDKSFACSSNLRSHERIHTGEKPYKCEYCSKSFRQSGERKKHTSRMHQSEMESTKSEQVEPNFAENM